MKLTDTQKELYSKDLKDIQRGYNLSGEKRVLRIAMYAAMGIFMVFLLFWLVFRRGEGKDFAPYLFAALKINYPSLSSLSPGASRVHIISFFCLGIAATALTPLITVILNNWIDRQVAEIENGLKVYKHIYNHYVLIGYNRMAPQILLQLLEKEKEAYAILMTNQNPIQCRKEIQSALPAEMAKRVIIYAGDALVKDKVETLNIEYAQKAFLLDESKAEKSQYVQNISILKNICLCASERDMPIEVYMQVNNSMAYSLLQRIDLPYDFFLGANGNPVVDFRPFNFYENWSRLLWSYSKKAEYDTLDFEPLEGTDKHVHLVIAGFDDMGKALLLEALRLCHYPNFAEGKGQSSAKNKTIISIFDADMERLEEEFRAQYPYLELIIDIDVQFYKESINSRDAREKIDAWSRDENTLLTIAVCEKDPDTAMTIALNLPEGCYYQKELFRHDKENPENYNRTRILVRQELEELSQIGFVSEDRVAYPHLHIFGTLRGLLNPQLYDDYLPICANVVYEYLSIEEKIATTWNINELTELRKKFIDAFDEKLSTERDKWRKRTETDKWSNRYQVDMYKMYLDMYARHTHDSLKEMDTLLEKMAEVEHRRWCAERVVSRWRQKDTQNDYRVNKKRIHESIIPYSELTIGDKRKDYNVAATVPLLVSVAQEKYEEEKNSNNI